MHTSPRCKAACAEASTSAAAASHHCSHLPGNASGVHSGRIQHCHICPHDLSTRLRCIALPQAATTLTPESQGAFSWPVEGQRCEEDNAAGQHSQARWFDPRPASCSIHAPAFIVTLLLLQSVAQACTVYEFGKGGFASGINQVFLLFPIFNGTNGPFYLDNRYNPYTCSETNWRANGWHDFFQAEAVGNWNASHEATVGEKCLRFKEFTDVVDVVNGASLNWEELQTESALKLWHYKPSMKDYIDVGLKRAREYPEPHIAFHMRGGDKFVEDSNQARSTTMPKHLVQTFTDSFPGVTGGTCFIMGDDHAHLDALEQLAKKEIECGIYRPHQYHAKEGHFQDKFIALDMNTRCNFTKQLLVDIELMAHADYFVGSYNSGLVSLVETLRWALYHKKRSTFMDASELHRDWYNRVRIYFRAGGRKKVETEWEEVDRLDKEAEEKEAEEAAAKADAEAKQSRDKPHARRGRGLLF